MYFSNALKPNIMAIHGSASTAKQWQSLADTLHGSVHFIAPDLPGYGTAATDNGARLAALERAVAGRTACLHLVAHSFGGAVALKFANARPERIASLTLYDPIAAGQGTGLPAELEAIWTRHRDGCDAGLMETFLTFWGGDMAWAALNTMQRTRLIAQAPGLRRDMSEVAAGQWALDKISYRGPLTILRGGRSPSLTYRMAGAIAARHRQARIVELEGFGHLSPITQAQAVNRRLCQVLIEQGADLAPTPSQIPVAA
jgi:pimeloyl-ACP methyl ester carboxylesterase